MEHDYCPSWKILLTPAGFEDCSLCPDLVVWNSSLKQVIIFELTVPLEENILNAASFKTELYKPLLNRFLQSGWWARAHPIQIGSRSLIDIPRLDPLFKFTTCSRKTMWLSLLHQVSLCCLFAIWCRRNMSDRTE